MRIKKFTFTVFFMAFFAGSFAQVTDTVFSENKVNGIWQNSILTIVTFNAGCAITSNLSLSWDVASQTWVNAYQSFFTYDAEARLTEQVTLVWDSVEGKWVNSTRNMLNYQYAGLQVVVSVQQTWDAANNIWINNFRDINTLDNAGNLTATEFFMFSEGKWQKSTRTLLSYTEDGRADLIKSLTWYNNTWNNSSKRISSYTGNGLSIGYFWDDIGKQWVKSNRDFNEYVDNTLFVKKSLSQYFINPSWQNSFRQQYEYNSDGKQVAGFQQIWEGSTASWLNLIKYNLDYFTDGAIKHFSLEVWDPATNLWNNGFRSSYTNNGCSMKATATPVAEIHNNAPKKQTGNSNVLCAALNRNGGNGRKLEYDFNITSPGGLQPSRQFTFQLALTTGGTNKAVGSSAINAVIAKPGNMQISPNPARGYFNINIQGKNGGEAVLKLTDVSGRVLLQQKIQGSGLQKIGLPSIPKGVYMVTVTSGQGIQSSKLVVE